jgi:hypothetical protein
MITNQRAVQAIGRIRANLEQSINCLKAVDDDLADLQKALTPTQEEVLEAMDQEEDRADVIASARADEVMKAADHGRAA